MMSCREEEVVLEERRWKGREWKGREGMVVARERGN